MASSDNFSGIIKEGLGQLGIKHDPELLNKLSTYYVELRKWSRAYNITALRQEREIALKLFIDSLLYLKVFPEPLMKTSRLLDVGSGGGFPGLVIKTVRPELTVTLLEPSWKRAAFLRHMISRLGLRDITVLQGTLEEMAASYQDGRSDTGSCLFDIVVTKALFSTYEFIKKTEGLITSEGALILSKGPAYKEEIAEVREKLKERASDYNIETIPVRLPLTDITRYFLRITRKSGP